LRLARLHGRGAVGLEIRAELLKSPEWRRCSDGIAQLLAAPPELALDGEGEA